LGAVGRIGLTHVRFRHGGQGLLRQGAGILAGQAQAHHFIAGVTDLHLAAQHVHREFFLHRSSKRARQLQIVVRTGLPDEEGRQHAAFRGIEAGELRLRRGDRLHVAGEEILQKSLRILAAHLEHAEMRNVAQHGAVARRCQLARRVAEMAHGALLDQRVLRRQKFLPSLIHRRLPERLERCIIPRSDIFPNHNAPFR
jgi:hypothetical protein